MSALFKARMVSLSGRYALALHDAFGHDHAVASLPYIMSILKSLSLGSMKVLNGFKIYPKESREFLAELSKPFPYPEPFIGFMHILMMHKRTKLLKTILELFIHYTYEKSGKTLATIISTQDLSESSAKNLEDSLKKKYGDHLAFFYKTQSDLLTGVVVRIGAEDIDASTSHYLSRLNCYLKDQTP